MRKEILTFGDIEIEENTFYCHKIPVPVMDVDNEIVLVCNKFCSYVKNCKYFIGYLYDDHKTSDYVKCYDGQTKWIYF